ncbi:asparagine synthetase B family protein [Streptomyces sioyaensis]|uniref:asparagine synthetase B family protein n=1 Tax=Streptomyces sioyaensis TaxID=67364 RepID=UPI0037D8BAD7
MARRLGASLAHRGRSGAGTYVDDLVSLHSARHAVIAIEEARQPLRDSASNYVLVGNGEILNYQDLKATLPPDRRRRLQPGDLQVAVELFAAQGVAGFEPLRGPFAMAIWDGDELTLVRDRLGERPLYYYDTPDLFMFASEVRCLEAALEGGLTLDEASILCFVGLGRTLSENTLYKEIKSVSPGEVLQLKGERLSRRRLAPIPDLIEASAGPGIEERVQYLIRQANHRMLVADCPVTVGFSGGIDSTVVLQAALEGADVAAAITIFSDRGPGIDANLRRSRAVATLMNVDLLEVPFTIPSLEETTSILDDTLDAPAAEPLVLHNNALHVAARDHAPVLLGGHGADEVFGGYDRYHALLADAQRSTTLEWMSASLWERWRRTAGWRTFVEEIAGDAYASYADFANDTLGRPFPYEYAEDTDPVLFGQALDLFRLMSYDNFRATDENGIAQGVEVRSPYFDLDLIAGVFALPLDRRIMPATKKHLLQQEFRNTPLEQEFTAKKVGFDDAFSYADWMHENWPQFSSTIIQGPLAAMDILRPTTLQHLSTLDWRLLWRLFSLTTWLNRRRRQ